MTPPSRPPLQPSLPPSSSIWYTARELSCRRSKPKPISFLASGVSAHHICLTSTASVANTKLSAVPSRDSLVDAADFNELVELLVCGGIRSLVFSSSLIAQEEFGDLPYKVPEALLAIPFARNISKNMLDNPEFKAAVAKIDLKAKASLLSVLQFIFNQLELSGGVGVGTSVGLDLKFIRCASFVQQDVDAFVNQQIRPQLWTSIPVASGPLLTFDSCPWRLLIGVDGAMRIGNPNRLPSQLNLDYSTPHKYYRVQSVIVHEGAVNSGQYYAHLRSNNSNQWFKADDKGNRFVSSEDEALGANNASMLLYILQEREG